MNLTPINQLSTYQDEAVGVHPQITVDPNDSSTFTLGAYRHFVNPNEDVTLAQPVSHTVVGDASHLTQVDVHIVIEKATGTTVVIVDEIVADGIDQAVVIPEETYKWVNRICSFVVPAGQPPDLSSSEIKGWYINVTKE